MLYLCEKTSCSIQNFERLHFSTLEKSFITFTCDFNAKTKMAAYQHMFLNFMRIFYTAMFMLPLQLTIEASDQALPDDRVMTTTVIITVPRDRQPPSFERPEMNAQTSETRNIGETLLNFRARDENLAVSLFFSKINDFDDPCVNINVLVDVTNL